jgi:hypothetical protein
MSEKYRCSKDTGENYSIVPAVGWLKIEISDKLYCGFTITAVLILPV